ncbi:MAG: hypothetical protein JWQ55_6576, partial [Rhodopila sp.]|nr:hypothetical protein [Rhodopila sp.]
VISAKDRNWPDFVDQRADSLVTANQE